MTNTETLFGVVFSTSVEVFLESRKSKNTCHSLLHVRGGVSDAFCSRLSAPQSSPRPWRCFSLMLMGSDGLGSSPRPWRCFSTAI